MQRKKNRHRQIEKDRQTNREFKKVPVNENEFEKNGMKKTRKTGWK